jgi:K+-transporting ATPase KdpF subunit
LRAYLKVTAMFDNILGLVLAALSLVYLTYAMLRPEKF